MQTWSKNPFLSTLDDLWRLFFAWQRFVRWTAFTLTGIFILLGVATVASSITLNLYFGLILSGIMFHTFAYVFNDIIDLPVDSINPDRQQYPLVKGTITVTQALIFAIIQFPLALMVTYYLNGGLVAYGALIVAFVMLTIYDIWGKVNHFPIMTDIVQGIGWGALVIYGADMATGNTHTNTWVMALAVTMFVVIFNGIHASFRDVASDLEAGRCTTTILLGVRPDNQRKRLLVPTRLKVYAWTLLFVQFGLVLYPLLTFSHNGLNWIFSLAGVVLFQGLGLWGSQRMFQQDSDFTVESLAYLYWIITIMSFITLWFPQINWSLRLAMVFTFVVPIMCYDLTYSYYLVWWRQQLTKLWANK